MQSFVDENPPIPLRKPIKAKIYISLLRHKIGIQIFVLNFQFICFDEHAKSPPKRSWGYCEYQSWPKDLSSNP